jgi:hypothetical protein
MEIIGSQIIYTFFGYIYMWIRYRNKEKIKQVLKNDYENSYSTIGYLVIWKPVGVIFLVLIVCLLIAAIIGSVRFGIRN